MTELNKTKQLLLKAIIRLNEVVIPASLKIAKAKEFLKVLARCLLFLKEIRILDESEQELFVKALTYAPKYFFTAPASSSGKYHPKYTTGKGGLVKHTKAAFWILNDLLNLSEYDDIRHFSSELLLAILLHDMFKQGMSMEGGHTVFEHPKLAAEFAKRIGASELVQECIASHMGQWNNRGEDYPECVLPLPESTCQKLVHLADYIASRKCVTVRP